MTTPSQTETARPLDGAMENILDDGQRPGWWRHFAGHEDTECVIRPMHLASLLDRAARTHGNRLAIRFQNFQMTYSRLHEAAERFAEALRLRGVKPGQRVAVMLPNIPQTVIAFWGIMKAGAVAVMTNPLYMEKELLHHFNDAGAEVLVTLDLLWAKLEPLRDRLPLRLTVVTNISDGLAFPLNWLYRIKARRQGQVPQVPYGQEVLRWKDFIKVRGRFSVPTDEDPGDALALLQYTGGTSGQPKGAMLGHACISAQMQQLLAILHMDWENCKPMSFLSIMPFFHVFGLVGNIILPTALAATTIPVPRYTPADLLRTIARFRPTFFVGAPSVYMSLMQQKDIKKYDLTCIEICVSGSAPFPTEALRRWVSMTHASITEGFGLTEASPCVTANPLDGPQKEGSIGVAFPHTEIRIVDINDSNHVLGPNEEGEMLVRGPQVMQGYWNRPEETAATLTDGWLHTGDIAYYDEDGYYYIVDRKKDLVIVGGYNVYPREVDEVLYEHPKVAEAVAVGVKHPTRGEVLKAYVVPRPGETLTTAESCTGGLLAKRITDVAGASSVFHQGVVTYANEAKTRLLGVPEELLASVGAVSPEVARCMAEQACTRYGSSWGVGISGIAGPGGATATKPVGLVYIALSNGRQTWLRVMRPHGRYMGRAWTRQRAASHALDMLRRAMLGLPVEMEA